MGSRIIVLWTGHFNTPRDFYTFSQGVFYLSKNTPNRCFTTLWSYYHCNCGDLWWSTLLLYNMPKRSILKPHDPDEMATSSNHNDKKTVRWGEMVVFEFPNMLGDNPAVSGGVPLTIAWNHVNVSTVTVEYNEFLRVKQPRRKRKDLVLSSAQRDTVSIFS